MEDIGFAQVDHHRELRKGFPEVIYGGGKTPAQIAAIAERILARSDRLLVTRASPEAFAACPRAWGLSYDVVARCIFSLGTVALRKKHALKKGYVLVVCAGTSDLPVAAEAALTARVLGCRVKTLTDVGVAGIHRLLLHRHLVEGASAIVCVAGMEGALPSVVGGLASAPVIAVPTSVGYGAAFGGIAALLGMLNSCASGVTVVNIDNGFGAAFAAYQILRLQNGR